MLSVTKRAGDYLAKALTESDLPDDVVFRIAGESGKMRVFIDKKKGGDVVFKKGTQEIIALDESLAVNLGNRTVDLEEDEEGYKLIML
jgi:hypothetical protein